MFNSKIINLIHILVTIFLLIKYIESSNKKTIENMSASNIDYEAIKNLGTIAKGLQKGGYTIPGNLTVNGDLKVTKTVDTNGIQGTYYIKSLINEKSKYKFFKKLLFIVKPTDLKKIR